MACSDALSLPGLDTAPLRALQSLLAALALADGDGVPGAALEALLEAIADGAAPDPEALRETRREIQHDDHVFYDDRYYEYENRLGHTVEELCTVDRDTLAYRCEQLARRVAAHRAYHAFWAHAHACGYFHDPALTRANAERDAREHVEVMWREISTQHALATPITIAAAIAASTR